MTSRQVHGDTAGYMHRIRPEVIPLQVYGCSRVLGQNRLFRPCKLRLRLSVDASLLSSSFQCLQGQTQQSAHCNLSALYIISTSVDAIISTVAIGYDDIPCHISVCSLWGSTSFHCAPSV